MAKLQGAGPKRDMTSQLKSGKEAQISVHPAANEEGIPLENGFEFPDVIIKLEQGEEQWLSGNAEQERKALLSPHQDSETTTDNTPEEELTQSYAGSKENKCADCGKSFTQRSSLFRHEKTHTGEKPCWNIHELESSVPRLGQKNYIVWAVKMECLLKLKELWYIVENPPQGVFAAADQKNHDQAMAYLILNLDDEQFLNVANLKTAKEIWLKLRAVNVSACNIVQLSRKLYRACLQPGESVEQHLMKMQTLFLELEQRGIKFPESQKVLLVLNSLDKTWDTVSAIFECKEEQDLSFEALKACLLNEEEKRHFGSSHEEVKFLRRGSRLQVSGEGKSSRWDPVTTQERLCKQIAQQERNCYICSKSTHLKKDCRGKVFCKEEICKKRRLICKRNILVLQKFAIAVTEASGASQTIVNDSELFYRFVPVAQEAVAWANGQKAKVIGRGGVKIPYLESRFTDVLCVPEMEHNLLSVTN